MSISRQAEVARFAPARRGRPEQTRNNVGDTGGAIIDLLAQAADLTHENAARAAETARRLAMDLRAAEDRIRALEDHARLLEERAIRAEQWLARIYDEIDARFMKRPANRDLRIAAE